ncbi:MAG: SDR family NAD(P)-dependent oxidoreductase [Candidatus Poribacteria bacterium]|nr:SDR family NAD(P)-dependent oxidoreductase [Candidatus Poribacteria bacterium]
MDVRVDGKVAFVTGANSGIGRAAAVEIAKAGAKVACIARRIDVLKDAVDEIEAAGGEAVAISCDVAEAAQVEAAVKQTVDKWGRLDIVVANAGINGVWAPIEEITADEWDQTQGINLRGTFLTVKYAIPHLKKAGGSIVVVASINGTRQFSLTGTTAYSCSKAGQVVLAKEAAVELAPWGIRVNAVCPGAITTNIGQNTWGRNLDSIRIPVQFPERRIPLTGNESGKAEQVGELILFLSSPNAGHITGTEVWIDGAESLLRC